MWGRECLFSKKCATLAPRLMAKLSVVVELPHLYFPSFTEHQIANMVHFSIPRYWMVAVTCFLMITTLSVEYVRVMRTYHLSFGTGIYSTTRVHTRKLLDCMEGGGGGGFGVAV